MDHQQITTEDIVTQQDLPTENQINVEFTTPIYSSTIRHHLIAQVGILIYVIHGYLTQDILNIKELKKFTCTVRIIFYLFLS